VNDAERAGGEDDRLLHEDPEYVVRQEKTEIAHSDEAGLQAHQECNDRAVAAGNAQSARCARAQASFPGTREARSAPVPSVLRPLTFVPFNPANSDRYLNSDRAFRSEAFLAARSRPT
jgi:hypothetical protein